jgi:hypothetical protein
LVVATAYFTGSNPPSFHLAEGTLECIAQMLPTTDRPVKSGAWMDVEEQEYGRKWGGWNALNGTLP